MEKSILKKLQTKSVLDLTGSNNGFSTHIPPIPKGKKNAVSIIDYIYPLTKLSSSIYQISDHVNLSGNNPLQGPQFIQLNDLYLIKSKYPKIVVVGLKQGIQPTKKEKAKLLTAGVKAYCYNLVPAAILAASEGLKVNAIGIVK